MFYCMRKYVPIISQVFVTHRYLSWHCAVDNYVNVRTIGNSYSMNQRNDHKSRSFPVGIDSRCCGVERSDHSRHKEIDVIYRSANYLVVNKDFDLLINKNDSTEDDVTVETLLKERFPELANVRLAHSFHFVHRLDYSTSGALCIALNKRAACEAHKAFSGRQGTRKYYLAMLRGHLRTDAECITMDMAVGKDSRPNYEHRMCTADKAYCVSPKTALTKLTVLQLGFYQNEQQPVTKVLLKPITGRRHQLRVHCLHLGHPVLGDFTYSDRTDTLPYRMFLHSYRLRITTSNEIIDLETEDPFREDIGRNQWRSVELVRLLDQSVYNTL